MGIGGVAPRILNLGSRWRWVVNLMPRLRYFYAHLTAGCMSPELVWTLWRRKTNPLFALP